MRNFIIFFEEKEGTSPLVRLLNNFEQISIIHQMDNKGWEPFDRHNCGSMALRNLECCLDMIFNKESIDFKRLNQIYTRTAKRPLEEFSKNGVVGFKMRFNAPTPTSYWSFRRMMFNILKRNDVVVFLAVRQDILKWGLSKYHGDGTGKPGHLQFKLASGKLNRDEIKKIHVDCARLEEIILNCEKSHVLKRRLMEDLKLAGIQSHPLRYEDFLTDKRQYISLILDFLELETSIQEINNVLKKGAYFNKVHSDDISDFVENHEELKERFDNRFVSWC